MKLFDVHNSRLLAACTASLLVATLAGPAANATTFDFTALCDDCARLDVEGAPPLLPFLNTGDGVFAPVTGTLELEDFAPNTPLGIENFSSFHYDGSGIPGFVGEFTVTSNDFISSVEGVLDATGVVIDAFSVSWHFNDQIVPGLDCGNIDLPGCQLFIDSGAVGGFWSIFDGTILADVGENAALTGATVVPMPLPGSLYALALGLFAMGLLRARHSR